MSDSCAVCGLAPTLAGVKSDVLLTCNKCGIQVHHHCYNLPAPLSGHAPGRPVLPDPVATPSETYRVPAEVWTPLKDDEVRGWCCDPCALLSGGGDGGGDGGVGVSGGGGVETTALACVACPVRGGALKLAEFEHEVPEGRGRQWCHVSCALWSETLYLHPVERGKGVGVRTRRKPQERTPLVSDMGPPGSYFPRFTVRGFGQVSWRALRRVCGKCQIRGPRTKASLGREPVSLCVQCAHPKCEECAHVECVRDDPDWLLMVDDTPQEHIKDVLAARRKAEEDRARPKSPRKRSTKSPAKQQSKAPPGGTNCDSLSSRRYRLFCSRHRDQAQANVEPPVVESKKRSSGSSSSRKSPRKGRKSKGTSKSKSDPVEKKQQQKKKTVKTERAASAAASSSAQRPLPEAVPFEPRLDTPEAKPRQAPPPPPPLPEIEESLRFDHELGTLQCRSCSLDVAFLLGPAQVRCAMCGAVNDTSSAVQRKSRMPFNGYTAYIRRAREQVMRQFPTFTPDKLHEALIQGWYQVPAARKVHFEATFEQEARSRAAAAAAAPPKRRLQKRRRAEPEPEPEPKPRLDKRKRVQRVVEKLQKKQKPPSQKQKLPQQKQKPPQQKQQPPPPSQPQPVKNEPVVVDDDDDVVMISSSVAPPVLNKEKENDKPAPPPQPKRGPGRPPGRGSGRGRGRSRGRPRGRGRGRPRGRGSKRGSGRGRGRGKTAMTSPARPTRESSLAAWCGTNKTSWNTKKSHKGAGSAAGGGGAHLYLNGDLRVRFPSEFWKLLSRHYWVRPTPEQEAWLAEHASWALEEDRQLLQEGIVTESWRVRGIVDGTGIAPPPPPPPPPLQPPQSQPLPDASDSVFLDVGPAVNPPMPPMLDSSSVLLTTTLPPLDAGPPQIPRSARRFGPPELPPVHPAREFPPPASQSLAPNARLFFSGKGLVAELDASVAGVPPATSVPAPPMVVQEVERVEEAAELDAALAQARVELATVHEHNVKARQQLLAVVRAESSKPSVAHVPPGTDVAALTPEQEATMNEFLTLRKARLHERRQQQRAELRRRRAAERERPPRRSGRVRGKQLRGSDSGDEDDDPPFVYEEMRDQEEFKVVTNADRADTDIMCSVCGSGDSEPDNAIVLCDCCDVAVHQFCYGVKEIPEGNWFCDRCANEAFYARCGVCMKRTGALKQCSEEGHWAHVVCAMWVPEMYFTDPENVAGISGVQELPHARRRLLCTVCKERGEGACIQCDDPKCVIAYHAQCARESGAEMITVRDTGTVDGVRFIVRCARHREELRKNPRSYYYHPYRAKRAKEVWNERFAKSERASRKEPMKAAMRSRASEGGMSPKKIEAATAAVALAKAKPKSKSKRKFAMRRQLLDSDDSDYDDDDDGSDSSLYEDASSGDEYVLEEDEDDDDEWHEDDSELDDEDMTLQQRLQRQRKRKKRRPKRKKRKVAQLLKSAPRSSRVKKKGRYEPLPPTLKERRKVCRSRCPLCEQLGYDRHDSCMRCGLHAHGATLRGDLCSVCELYDDKELCAAVLTDTRKCCVCLQSSMHHVPPYGLGYQRVVGDGWAHTVCLDALREIRTGRDPPGRGGSEPIVRTDLDVAAIYPERRHLECHICHDTPRGVTVLCAEPSCGRAMHPSCAVLGESGARPLRAADGALVFLCGEHAESSAGEANVGSEESELERLVSSVESRAQGEDDARPSREGVDADGEAVYCYCQLQQAGFFMVGCDVCGDWFHGCCVGMVDDPDALEEVQWACPFCCALPSTQLQRALERVHSAPVGMEVDAQV